MPRSSNLRLLNAGKVEIWTPAFYGIFKSMSVTFMDSMSMFIVQTLGLQLMRRERPLLNRLSKLVFFVLFSQKAFELNMARIRLSLKRLLLIGLFV